MESKTAGYIYIKGDMNDADYTAELSEVNGEDLILLRRFAEVLNRNKEANKGDWNYNNFPSGEYCDGSVEELFKDDFTEDEIDHLKDFVPFGEYGIHDIEEIKFFPVEPQSFFER